MDAAAIHHPEWAWNSGVLLWYMLTAEVYACPHQWQVTGHVKHHVYTKKSSTKTKVKLIIANCTVALPDCTKLGHLLEINENVLSCRYKYLQHKSAIP